MPATNWKKVIVNTMFFTSLSVSISSLIKLLAIETNHFFKISLILLSKSSRRVHGTRFCMLCLVSRTWSWICEKDGGDVASPAGLFPRTLPRKRKSGPMPPSRAKNWRQKSANPALFPRMYPGSTPRDGRW